MSFEDFQSAPKATLADLLLPEETKEIPFKTKKGTVKVIIRKLKTKHLAKVLKQVPDAEKDPIGFATALVAMGLSEPALTIEQVGDLDVKDVTDLSTEITKFSGFTEDSTNEAKKYPTPEKAGQSGT